MSGLAAKLRSGVAWGMFGQISNSAGNFIVIVLAARALSPDDVGAFTIAMTWVLTVAIVVRGLASDVLASAHSADSESERHQAARVSATTALVASVPAALLSVVISFFLAPTLAHAFLVAAVLTPGLVLQDFICFALIVLRRSKKMFVNQTFWTVVQIPFLLVTALIHATAWSLLLAWGLGGVIAAVLGFWQASTWFAKPSTVRPWLRRYREMWPYYVLDNLLNQAGNFGLILVISFTTTLPQVAAARAVMTVFAPLTIVGRGLIGVGVPAVVRRQPRSILRLVLKISTAIFAVAVVYVAAASLTPDGLGRALLGQTWPLTEPLILLAGISNAAGLFTMGIVIGIRSLGAGKAGLTARVITTLAVVVCATVGSVIDGAKGLVWALAILGPMQTLVWWLLLVKAARRQTPTADSAAGDAGEPDVAEEYVGRHRA